MKRLRYLVGLILLPIFLAGCDTTFSTLPLSNLAPKTAENQAVNYLIAPQNATATPTPFQPVHISAVATNQTGDRLPMIEVTQPAPESTLSAEIPPVMTSQPGFQGGKPTPDYAMTYDPPPAEPIQLSPDVQALILLGTDNQSYSSDTGRTDTIILVLYNVKSGRASLVSVPRDLYVFMPGWTMQRVNTAYRFGGVELVYETMEYNLGIRPSHYILVHFDDVFHFINDIGGLDVPVSTPMPYCGGIPTGVVNMDGSHVLCYMRIREGSNDFDRSRRQQEVLNVLLKKAMTPDTLAQLPRFYNRYSQTAKTDLGFTEIVKLVPFAIRVKNTDGLHQFQISHDYVTDWMDWGGAMVLLPSRYRIQSLLQDAVNVLDPDFRPTPTLTPIPVPTAIPSP